MIMKKRPETKDPRPDNPNDHKNRTPSTKNARTDKKFTSYDTKNPETATPQTVRESKESSKELERHEKAS
jgi:hypothetical protein